MRRLVGAFAGRTYHIVGNLMSQLNYSIFIFVCMRAPNALKSACEYTQNSEPSMPDNVISIKTSCAGLFDLTIYVPST